MADVKNDGGPAGGAITAALFLQRFVSSRPWAHLDMAGTTWQSNAQIATLPDGARAFGVRLLHRFVAGHHESAQ